MRLLITVFVFLSAKAITDALKLSGIKVKQVKSKKDVDLGESLVNGRSTLIVFGTYAADFNAIE